MRFATRRAVERSQEAATAGYRKASCYSASPSVCVFDVSRPVYESLVIAIAIVVIIGLLSMNGASCATQAQNIYCRGEALAKLATVLDKPTHDLLHDLAGNAFNMSCFAAVFISLILTLSTVPLTQ